MRFFRLSLLTVGVCGIALASCGGKQSAAPPTFTGEASVGTVLSTASPAPGQVGWPCTVQVYTAAGSSTPTTTTGTCGTAELGGAPAGSISCQVTLPGGGAAVGWCLPGTSASPMPSASPSAVPSPTASASSGTSGTYLYVSPSSIALTTAQTPSQVMTVLVSGGAGFFTVVSGNTAVVTVSPASGAGPFTVTEVSPGSTTLTVTDSTGNTLSVPVTAQ